MSFADDVKRFTVTLQTRNTDIFVGVVEEATRSIVEGSEITGAPGSPVDTGNLKSSWQTVFDSPTQATIGTNVEYAQAIEDGIGKWGPLQLRSAVGGFHSLALTRVNFQRIVDAVTRRVSSGGS